MKYIISNYNNDISWIKDYTDDYVIYNQGEPIEDKNTIQVPHAGTDIADKFKFIIDNYDNLPEVAVYCKANFLGKSISKEEYEKVKDNREFTPLLTQNHKTYGDEDGPICCYKQGMYFERNNYWYANWQNAKYLKEIIKIFKMTERNYNCFAPGSNYILPKENILKHPKSLYETLRSYLIWHEYPIEAQMLERNLFYLWNINIKLYDL